MYWYPDLKLVPWMFGDPVEKSFWKNTENQRYNDEMIPDLSRSFFDWLGLRLGYKHLDDWYKVTKDDICGHGGAGLLVYYYDSTPLKALRAIYPHHKWMK